MSWLDSGAIAVARHAPAVRAPWHRPGLIAFNYIATIPSGWLELRADSSYSVSNYPDLAALLGVSSGTFTLSEMRGEFIRALDSGRGIDAGRAVRSAQSQAVQTHAHTAFVQNPNGATTSWGIGVINNAGTYATTDTGIGIGPETRPRNIALPIIVSY